MAPRNSKRNKQGFSNAIQGFGSFQSASQMNEESMKEEFMSPLDPNSFFQPENQECCKDTTSAGIENELDPAPRVNLMVDGSSTRRAEGKKATFGGFSARICELGFEDSPTKLCFIDDCDEVDHFLDISTVNRIKQRAGEAFKATPSRSIIKNQKPITEVDLNKAKKAQVDAFFSEETLWEVEFSDWNSELKANSEYKFESKIQFL